MDPDGFVELEFDRGSRCAGCAGACTWSRPDAPRRVKFRSAASLEPGTVVRVTLPADHVLASALLLHGLPLAALLVGGGIGAAIAGSDVGTLAGALTGITLALAASRGLRRRAEESTFTRATLEPRG